MKILTYKYLKEDLQSSIRQAAGVTGINQRDMRSLVGLNRKNATNIGNVSVVDIHRVLGFSFVTKQSYNAFLNNANLLNALQVENNMSYNFYTYYDNNYCYLYPFADIDVPAFSEQEVMSYLRFRLFRRADENQAEDVEVYFNNFTNTRNEIENENNVKNYSLEILGSFNDINRDNNITNQGILNLPQYAANNPAQSNYYISFNMVGRGVNVGGAVQDANNISYNIDFNQTPQQQQQGQQLTQLTPQQQQQLIDTFDRTFNGRQLTLIEERRVQPPQGLPNNIIYLSVYTARGGTIRHYIYTERRLQDYINIQQLSDCYISTNNTQIIPCQFRFN